MLTILIFKFQQILANYTHGVKRSGSYSRDGENHKVSKYKHQNGINYQKDDLTTNMNNMNSSKGVNMQNQQTNMACNDTIYQSGVSLEDFQCW